MHHSHTCARMGCIEYPPQVLKRKLDGGGVTLPVYGSRRDAVLAAGGSGTAAGEMLLRAGDVAPLWLGPLPDDKLPKDATAGAHTCTWWTAVPAVCPCVVSNRCLTYGTFTVRRIGWTIRSWVHANRRARAVTPGSRAPQGAHCTVN